MLRGPLALHEPQELCRNHGGGGGHGTVLMDRGLQCFHNLLKSSLNTLRPLTVDVLRQALHLPRVWICLCARFFRGWIKWV